MPRHDYDPNAVTVTFKTFQKGDYELIVGEPKAFQGTNAEGNENFGIRWPMKIVAVIEEGQEDAVGERSIYSCYLNGGAAAFGKAFAMAALGFAKNEAGESEFNEVHGNPELWGFDTDDHSCGDGWRECTGNHIIASMSIQANPIDGTPRQQFDGFRPVGS